MTTVGIMKYKNRNTISLRDIIESVLLTTSAPTIVVDIYALIFAL